MRALEKRVPPPLVTLAIAIAMGVAAAAAPPGPLSWPVRAAGALLLFAAAGFYGPRAICAFGRAGTTIDPIRVERASALVTTGVFGRTRNPMYVSMALLLAAWAVWLGRLLPALGPIVFVAYTTRSRSFRKSGRSAAFLAARMMIIGVRFRAGCFRVVPEKGRIFFF